MKRLWTGCVGAVLLAASGIAAGQPASIPPALAAMADTERAFARRATEVGVRASFLEYFADDAIAFGTEPGPAKAGIEKQRAVPPSVVELTWEPRLGDAAASGEIGYLTGPARRVVHQDNAPPPSEVCYFSIWKKQPDGSFKVFIDQGISTPGPAPFAPGFMRANAEGRFRGTPDPERDRTSLLDADLGFANASGLVSTASAYRRYLASDGRLYRDGSFPLIGLAETNAWLERAGTTRMSTEPLRAETARSGDLGFTYGRYSIIGPKAEGGHYVRVWVRDEAGTWRIAVDVTAPRPSSS